MPHSKSSIIQYGSSRGRTLPLKPWKRCARVRHPVNFREGGSPGSRVLRSIDHYHGFFRQRAGKGNYQTVATLSRDLTHPSYRPRLKQSSPSISRRCVEASVKVVWSSQAGISDQNLKTLWRSIEWLNVTQRCTKRMSVIVLCQQFTPLPDRKSRRAPVQNVTRGIPGNVGTHVVTSFVKIGISSFVSIPGGIVWNCSGNPGIQRQESWLGIAIDIDSPGEAGDILESVSLYVPVCCTRELRARGRCRQGEGT